MSKPIIINSAAGQLEFDVETQIMYVITPTGERLQLSSNEPIDVLTSWTDPDLLKKIKRKERIDKIEKIFSDESESV